MDVCATGYCFHVPKTEWNIIVIYSIYVWHACTMGSLYPTTRK